MMSEQTRSFGDDLVRPGEAMLDANLFEPIVNQETMQQIGVTTPEGRFFPFIDGEQFVSVLEKNSTERRVFIKTKHGDTIPFTDWSKQFWRYDAQNGQILDPGGKTRSIDSLSEEELFACVIEIRRSVSGATPWPSNVAEHLTKKYMSMKAAKKRTSN